MPSGQLQGVGSVLLVARVESLSVGAVSAFTGQNGGAAANPEVAITTSWAVPANYTTFRLVGYVSDQGPFGGDVEAAQGVTAGSGAGSGKAGEALLVLDSGDTNAAKTRTDAVAVQAEPQSEDEQVTDGETGRFTILVQAL